VDPAPLTNVTLRAKPLNWDQYAANWAMLHGGFDPRRASTTVQGWMRLAYGLGRLAGRLHVPPSAVTTVGLLLSVAVPVTAARGPGWPLTAAVLVLLGAVADSTDGAIAVVMNRVTRRGSVYDSVADRLGEASWLAALWLVGAPGPLVVACGAMSWLHEYIRARASAVGMRQIGPVTTGERPSRVSVALVGLLLAGGAGLIDPDLAAGTATVAASIWAFLAVFGLGQLLRSVRSAPR
jgi:CDP-diacylglycerol--glycerol-3-phosphate 3-phosphatidyltransferase